MKVVFIGAGNLATRLAIEMHKHSFSIIQIYSRTIESAKVLAAHTDSKFTNDVKLIDTNADVYIFSLKDSVLPMLLNQIPPNNGIWLHTAGSISIDVFKEKNERYGVLYPYQTFSKHKELDFKTIPIFVEGNNDQSINTIKKIANTLSNKVVELSSDKREYLHLAGVFACNFVNDMYCISDEILSKTGIPFNLILPLINETASKVLTLSPYDAQTGPAIRYDQNVIDKHLTLLESPDLKDIYTILSTHIYKTHNKNMKIQR